MNLKKAKLIRQTLRKAGKDWREKEYSMLGGRFNGDKLVVTGTIALSQGCGRKVYKATKGVSA